jgi:cytochrome b561
MKNPADTPAQLRVSRYHPLLVAMHWLLAALILAALAYGSFVLDDIPNSDPRKTAFLKLHMAAGIVILVLMAIRFVVRMSTARPAYLTTGNPLLDRLAPVAYYGFYVLVLLMVGTGLATALLARLNRIVFQHSGEPLPPNFGAYPSFLAHSILAAALAGLIVLHAVMALYHEFIIEDGIFRRMSIGPRGGPRR